MDNYKIEKFKWVCMENSIGCKIGNFQTESNVIMLHKHSNKSAICKKSFQKCGVSSLFSYKYFFLSSFCLIHATLPTNHNFMLNCIRFLSISTLTTTTSTTSPTLTTSNGCLINRSAICEMCTSPS